MKNKMLQKCRAPCAPHSLKQVFYQRVGELQKKLRNITRFFFKLNGLTQECFKLFLGPGLLSRGVPLSENSTAATGNARGVTYFGDGRWGITGSDDLTKIKTEVGRDGQQLFKGDIQNHLWLIEMNSASDGGKVLDISAIGTQGKIDGAKWDKKIHC